MFLNAFKNLFTPKPTKTALKKGIRRRKLELLGLEDRIVPAVPFSPAFPHALSITAGSSTSTSAAFTVTFNQPVTGVDATDFNLIATGTVANGTISSLTGSGDTYTINVTGITGTGTLGLNLVDLPSITALPSFAPQTTFATGNKSNSVTLGDVNTDGNLDIITANPNSNSVSVLLGNGNGTYQAQQTFATGTNPGSVTLGDVNGDGKLDIVTRNANSNNSSVLLGNGDGTFQAQQTFATGTQPSSVTLGDVNRDGKLDIITSNFGSDSVSVLLGNGDGTFQAKQDFTTPITPSSVTLGDVNGDGKLDIITANYNTINASVLLGNGDGTFQSQQTFATGNGPQSVTLGDVNGDGRLDLITANSGVSIVSGNVSVLLGNGNGTFAAQTTFTTGNLPRIVTLGDVNGDGKLDIITANSGSDSTSVLLGNGNGTFQPKVDFTTGSGPFSVTLGDVNADGRLDIVTANLGGSGSASVLLGTGGSAITATFLPQQTFAADNSPVFVTLGDVNGDGDLDIVTANLSADNVSVLLGNGNGTFGAQATFATGSFPDGVTLGDVNRDGKLDIVVSNLLTNSVSVLLGNGNGTFKAQSTFAVGTLSTSVTLGDVNSDGKLDIITGNSGSSSVLLGNGNGTFQTQATTATGPTGGSTADVTLADVNSDGKLDLIYAQSNGAVPYYVGVLLGNGNGTFQTEATFDVGTGTKPSNIAVGDVNGDGRLDIITANVLNKSVGVLLGNGNGTFQSVAILNAGNLDVQDVKLGDVNGDGRLDIITGNNSTNNSSVLLGNGNGTFQAQLTFATGTNARGVVVGDVNGDGRLDIITANQGSANVSVLLNSIAFTGQTVTISSGPTVTSSTSNLAATATTLIITGTGFNTTAGNNTVTLSSGTGTVTSATATQLTITLNTPPSVGNLTAVVTSNGSSSGSPVQVATVVAGAATQATLTTPAAGSASGSAFTTQPIITIQDALGNTVTNSNASVTMTVSGGDNKATTVGTVTINAVNGVANFSGVGISGTAGTTYTLTFASNGLTSATQSITPTFGAATQLTLGTPAAGSASGSAFTTQPVITIKDAFGNTVTNSTAAVTMSVSGNGTTVGTATVNAVAGVATFSNVGISGTAGTPYTLTFASAGLTSATQSITPTFGAATQATLSTPAAGSVSGSAFTTQPVVTIKDAFGNTVTNSTAAVTMTVSGNGTTVGTATVNAVAGVATFTNAGISGTIGTPYTLTFASNGLTSATQSITPLGAANTPTFGAPTPTADGFTVQISNYDPNFTYGGTATANGTVAISNTGLVTVTGVAPNTSSTATITTTRTNYVSGSAPVTASSLNAANTPTFGAPTPTASGFTVQITNYDPNFTYGGTATANGTVAISNTGLVTVTGVAPNTSSTATVTTTRTNYVSGSAPVTATSLNAANIPTFGATTPTADGFTVQITNYNGAFSYGGTATANGTVTISNTGLVTVTGVAAGASSTATITTSQVGFANGSAPVTANALASKPLITGTPSLPSSSGASTVNLYDPATGQPTGTAVPFPGYDGPVKVASGDFNNDGVAELVAGAGFGGGPAIAILNSQTGEILETFFAFSPAFTGGVFVAVQDTNGDGILDIIAAAGPGGGPEVRIFNGSNLNVLRSFFAYAEDFSGGVSVASIDFNNDGILDLVTGAGPGGAPQVKVFDGATNAVISQWYAYPVSFTGGVLVAVGDIGNDGTFEVLTGAGPGGAPVAAVWDPFTGALISQFMAYADVFTGGVRVAINDGNGDGIADLITGAGPTGGPHVKVFSFPDLDILFQFYSGEESNPGGVFVS